MKALWIVTGVVARFVSDAEPEQALLGCPVASARMRMAVGALAWKRAGHQNIYWNPETGSPPPDIDWATVTVCVVPKFFVDATPEAWLHVCRSARDNGCPLVLDICEYPFKQDPAGHPLYPPVDAFYGDALKICDAVAVNSERMAELMARHAPRPPVVIDDAVLAPERNVEFAPAGRLRLTWFGHSTNLPYLNPCIDALVRFARQRPCRLTVVSEAASNAREVAQSLDARFAPALEVRFVEWSLEAMASALRRSDLVLIPSDRADPLKAGVSANRIAEVLRAGRFPVASPLASYLPFSDAAWLGDDLIEGIGWALANPADVRARIRRGQALVEERFAQERVGGEWRALFERLARLP